MNPMNMVKIPRLFQKNHPKAADYLTRTFRNGIPAGTVLELQVTKPGRETERVKITVKEEDAALIKELSRIL